MQKHERRLLFLSSLGGVLEFYDFIIYALFADYISSAFFPSSNPLVSLMIAFATFALGYLVRPLGGMVFGHYGDRIGRKKTFTISILMMAAATLGMGLAPTFNTIGHLAPILIITLRIIQGISIGGEIPGAITYVSESLESKRGLACGIIFCALTMGIVLGSLIQALVVSIFTPEQMQFIGWRIPFLLGGVFGIISYMLRRDLHESSEFIAVEKTIENYPVFTVFKHHSKPVIAGGFIVAVCAAIITSLFLFTPAYFTKILHLPPNSYIWERTGAVALGSMLTMLFGYLSDIYSKRSLIMLMSVTTALLAYPIYFTYVHFPDYYATAFLLSALLMGFSAGCVPCLLAELFPTQIRYSGIAISYNLGFAIFGGLTPFISLSLIYYTGWDTTPALYLVVVSLFALAAMAVISQRQLTPILSSRGQATGTT